MKSLGGCGLFYEYFVYRSDPLLISFCKVNSAPLSSADCYDDIVDHSVDY